MCESLFCLEQGTLDCNLITQQWLIVEDACATLKPFMFVPHTFEGKNMSQ